MGLLVVLAQVARHPRRQNALLLRPLLLELLYDLNLVFIGVAYLKPVGVAFQEHLQSRGSREEGEHEQPVHRVRPVVDLLTEPLEELV